jgi:hypothetical protein
MGLYCRGLSKFALARLRDCELAAIPGGKFDALQKGDHHETRNIATHRALINSIHPG